jgi:hypothetical protein
MLVAACGSSPSSPASPAGSSTPTPSAAPATPTSEELIAAALASGSITLEESLLYRALALYDSPGLPQQYRSTVPDMHAAGKLMREIDATEKTLSPDLLAKLAPYRARPNDPISIYNTLPARTGAAQGRIVFAADTTPSWKSLPTAGGKARVWVKASATADAELRAHVDDVAKVWAAYPGIFTYPRPDQAHIPTASVNPDSAIDFYFVDASDLDPRRPACLVNSALPDCVFGTENYGYAQEADERKGNKSSAYLVIDAATGGDQLIDTLAHELAHAGQFAYDKDESSWLMESTATWVAYKVMKQLGLKPEFAYKWLGKFFDHLDQPLTREADYNAYASWLYFLFASMKKGDGVVTDVWKAAAADGVQGEKAVDKAFPFDSNFADFSVRDWNKAPVDPLYKSADATFPSGYQPQTRNKVKTLEGGKQDSLSVSLPPLASAYYEYVFPDSALDVTFENSLSGVANAHVWAMENVKDKWLAPVDWTKQARPTFCRAVPDEDLGQVVIVVSNTSMTKDLKVPEPPKMVAGTKGCSGWSGTMTGTYTWSMPNTHGSGTATFSGLWAPAPDGQPVVPCQSGLPGSCLAYLPRGSIHWTWNANLSGGVTCTEDLAGDALAGSVNDPRNGAGGAGIQASSQVFVLQPDGSGHYGYWGLGSWGLATKMKCSDGIRAVTAPPGYLNLDADATGSGAADGTGNTCSNTTWQIDAKAESIKGSCFLWSNSGGSMLYEWDLKRVGPAPGS